MKRCFHCPHCEGLLNPGTKIIIRAARDLNTSLFLFSPQVGNYNLIMPDDFRLSIGDRVTFYCPVCGADLTSEADEDLALVECRVAGRSPFDVHFSRIFGTHATFVVRDGTVSSFGEHANNYHAVNFFGEGDKD
jgi:predicted RNA-binding Zn-ribbon protein involved in translation (DUF1610 family)